MIFVNVPFIQTSCESVPGAEDKSIVLLGVTIITPFVVTTPQPPVKVIV